MVFEVPPNLILTSFYDPESFFFPCLYCKKCLDCEMRTAYEENTQQMVESCKYRKPLFSSVCFSQNMLLL